MANLKMIVPSNEGCAEEEFDMSGSDEESGLSMKDAVEWEPKPEEITELFESLDKNKVLNLEWQCPERRPLTPDIGIEERFTKYLSIGLSKETSPDKTGFDFEEETSPMKMQVRPVSGPRGSAKKKTTNLDDILLNMARHRKLDMMKDDD